MRNLWLAGVVAASLICSTVHAGASTGDDIFANAALRELHNLAVASVKSAQAAKDGDNLGCRYANESMEEAAHNALEDMHYMSFAPFDAIQFVSTLLRLEHLAQPNGCSFDSEAHLLPLTAGQAIMALRWDYAIGDGNWYVVEANGDVNGKNPLHYSQSLKDLGYSWVSTRPKNMGFIVEPDWKSEMASDRVDDSSIENSGENMQAVEVDYRMASNDETAEIYFYRTKDGAIATAQEGRQRAEDDAKADVERKAAESDWKQKLAALPFIVANHDVGFKLIYGFCKPADNDPKDVVRCNDYDSHDWSDDPHLLYRWFSDIQECEGALDTFRQNHPLTAKFNTDGFFTYDCVPAPKVIGPALTGYQMVLAISAPVSGSSQVSYENLREGGSGAAILFKNFNVCYKNVNDAYSKIEQYLNVDGDGNFLSDKTKSITVVANCVRIY